MTLFSVFSLKCRRPRVRFVILSWKVPVMQLSEEQTESYASNKRNPFSRNCKFISAIVSLSKVSKTFTLGRGGGWWGVWAVGKAVEWKFLKVWEQHLVFCVILMICQINIVRKYRYFAFLLCLSCIWSSLQLTKYANIKMGNPWFFLRPIEPWIYLHNELFEWANWSSKTATFLELN